MIRKAINLDIERLVKIHRDSLPYSLLSRLGKEFLRKKFYPLILNSDNVLLLVKELKGEVVGFALFTYNGNLLTKEIMKHKISLSIALIKKVLSDFKILFAVLRRLKTPRTVVENQVLFVDEMPELYELAVSSNFRNKGIGSELTEKGLSILREKNQPKCIVRSASYVAHNFFLKLGFYDIGKEVRGKSERFVMAYDLT